MELTHFGHSCLLAEFGVARLLFDPGTFSHGFEGITGLSAILITHQHPDHADPQRLPALVEANPGAALYADPQTAAQLGGDWRAVHVGDDFTITYFDHALGAACNFGIVGNQQDRVTLRIQITQQAHHIFAAFAIERAGGFVGQNDRTTIHQRARNRHTLLLPA